MDASSEFVMQKPGPPEQHLLALCREGDRDALARIYSDYEGAIYRYALHVLGHREDAHDIRQETFLKAFQSIGRFRGDCSIKTWLFTICTNLCRRHRSAHRRRDELAHEAIDYPAQWSSVVGGEHGDPAHAVERAATMQVILLALQSLPRGQREIIVLREIERMSYEEIAAQLGYSRNGLRVTLFRARKRFAERANALLKEMEC